MLVRVVEWNNLLATDIKTKSSMQKIPGIGCDIVVPVSLYASFS